MGEKERVEAYMATVARIEPDITQIDVGAACASIAISARRTADDVRRMADALDEFLAWTKSRWDR